MCGICGLISEKHLDFPQIDSVAKMNEALSHRGPDDTGIYKSSFLVLMMKRLKIIDLEHGNQPLFNENKSLVLVANGEIYNHIELREKLEGRGHQFKTHSDCETILHLYEEKGEECVHELRGMFAFSLWDSKRRRLLLGRDRMGEKPLYLYENNGQLVFASELRALMCSGLVPFELDPSSIDMYFHYHYVPEPATPIKGIRKLPAAHILKVDVDGWRTKESCYWRMEDASPLDGNPTELIRAELDKVSELIIRSDVPVGVALSGGLDSSAIAALASRKYPGTMHAFSVGYPGHPHNDERTDAKTLANLLGIPFHDIELAKEDMVAFFPELVFKRDDPIADISGYGYYAVSKLASDNGVPVIMQGQGGDELFWGYSWVRRAVTESKQKFDSWRKGHMRLADYIKFNLPEELSRPGIKSWINSVAGLRSGWQSFIRNKKTPPERLVFYDLSPDFQMAWNGVKDIYAQSFIDSVRDCDSSEIFSCPQPWPPVDILLTRLICQTYLQENGIAQGDRLSMASSVELRLPLLDYRLVETVIGLRKSQPDFQLPPKAWFKAALKDILPEWVINRRKRGFEPPVEEWYRSLFTAYGSSLDGGCLVEMGIIKPESARFLSKGPLPEGIIVPLSFKALVLEMWCRRISSEIN